MIYPKTFRFLYEVDLPKSKFTEVLGRLQTMHMQDESSCTRTCSYACTRSYKVLSSLDHIAKYSMPRLNRRTMSIQDRFLLDAYKSAISRTCKTQMFEAIAGLHHASVLDQNVARRIGL